MRASPSRTPAQTHTSTRARHAIVRDLHASNPHMACRDSLRGTSRTERLELISVLRNHEMRVGLWLGQRSAKHMHRLDGNASRSASRAQSWQLQPRWTTSNEQRATCIYLRASSPTSSCVHAARSTTRPGVPILATHCYHLTRVGELHYRKRSNRAYITCQKRRLR